MTEFIKTRTWLQWSAAAGWALVILGLAAGGMLSGFEVFCYIVMFIFAAWLGSQ